jgi:hypothetical protein
MKLSTKKIFESTKKRKYSKKIKLKSSTVNPQIKIESNHINKNEKIGVISIPNKYANTTITKINPFNPFNNISRNKKLMNLKTKENQLKKDKILFNTLEENILSIKFDLNMQNNDKEMDIEEPSNIFPDSKLKKVIIMDNQGNNNIDSEQKQFIKNCFDEKNKLEKNIKQRKFTSLKTMNFHINNLSKHKNYDIKAINSFRTTKRINTVKNKTINIGKSNLSKKNSFGLKNLIIFVETKNKEDENKKKMDEERENNSMFENCTNKSFDSSFLGSSMDDDLFKKIK